MKKIISCVVIFLIIVTQSGCSTFGGTRQRISVVTSEPDAKIYINGELIGNGNVQTWVRRNEDVAIMAKKDNYYPATRHIGTTMSFLGILDIIGGCCFLLPFIGLAFPGSQKLDQSNVSMVLEEKTNQ